MYCRRTASIKASCTSAFIKKETLKFYLELLNLKDGQDDFRKKRNCFLQITLLASYFFFFLNAGAILHSLTKSISFFLFLLFLISRTRPCCLIWASSTTWSGLKMMRLRILGRLKRGLMESDWKLSTPRSASDLIILPLSADEPTARTKTEPSRMCTH